MLFNQGAEDCATMMKMAERCRPDYEAQIKRQRERLEKSESLKHALLNYLDGRRTGGPLAEMLGELVTECMSYEKSIADLIARQEADPEK